MTRPTATTATNALTLPPRLGAVSGHCVAAPVPVDDLDGPGDEGPLPGTPSRLTSAIEAVQRTVTATVPPASEAGGVDLGVEAAAADTAGARFAAAAGGRRSTASRGSWRSEAARRLPEAARRTSPSAWETRPAKTTSSSRNTNAGARTATSTATDPRSPWHAPAMRHRSGSGMNRLDRRLATEVTVQSKPGTSWGASTRDPHADEIRGGSRRRR